MSKTILTDSGFLNNNWKNINKKELYSYLHKWETSQLTTRKLKFARDGKDKTCINGFKFKFIVNYRREENKIKLVRNNKTRKKGNESLYRLNRMITL